MQHLLCALSDRIQRRSYRPRSGPVSRVLLSKLVELVDVDDGEELGWELLVVLCCS